MCLRKPMKGGCVHVPCSVRLLRVILPFTIECTESLLTFLTLFSEKWDKMNYLHASRWLGLFFSDNFETQADLNYHATGLIPVSARSKAWVCVRWLAGIVMSNPNGARISVCFNCCVLSGRGLCVGLITQPEESCLVWNV
jgi:hypothetical protein